jgi:hypothetical protein
VVSTQSGRSDGSPVGRSDGSPDVPVDTPLTPSSLAIGVEVSLLVSCSECCEKIREIRDWSVLL